MIIFPGLFEITSAKQAVLDKYILQQNRIIIWTYGAGITDGHAWTPEKMKSLTGAVFLEKNFKITENLSWKSIYFSSTDEISPEVLREIAQDAGVHLYTDIPTPVIANKQFLMIHVADKQQITVNLPEKVNVTELLDGSFRKAACDQFIYNFTGPETALFKLSEIL